MKYFTNVKIETCVTSYKSDTGQVCELKVRTNWHNLVDKKESELSSKHILAGFYSRWIQMSLDLCSKTYFCLIIFFHSVNIHFCLSLFSSSFAVIRLEVLKYNYKPRFSFISYHTIFLHCYIQVLASQSYAAVCFHYTAVYLRC